MWHIRRHVLSMHRSIELNKKLLFTKVLSFICKFKKKLLIHFTNVQFTLFAHSCMVLSHLCFIGENLEINLKIFPT